EGAAFPASAVRRSILHGRHPVGVGDELECVRALGAEAALVDRTVGIALNGDGPLALREYEKTAADGAVRTHAMCHLCSAQTGLDGGRSRADWLPVTERAWSVHALYMRVCCAVMGRFMAIRVLWEFR